MVFIFALSYLLYAVKDTLSAVASLGATGMFIWYVYLIFTNRSIMGNMPKTWETVNKVIACVAALHCLLIAMGKTFFQFTWITMAGLIGLLTMQHVVVTNFRTNG
jgi:protein tyrosine phosphatase